MSIEETSVIDFVSTDERGSVILTITDHLDWSSEEKHLLLLQEKINAYCQYIENGQIYDEYPEVRDMRPIISVVLFHELTSKAESFFRKVSEVLGAEGFGFELQNYRNEP